MTRTRSSTEHSRGRRRPTVVIALGVLIGTWLAVATTTAPVTAATPTTTAQLAFGEPVRDGMFEFTIKKLSCGRESVGSDEFGEKAQGEFCFVTMNVKNIGNEARLFDASDQKAKTADGQTYEADSLASMTVNEDDIGFLTEINPGNQVRGVVVYDVPKGTKLTTIELHDSPFSGGVEAPLK